MKRIVIGSAKQDTRTKIYRNLNFLSSAEFSFAGSARELIKECRATESGIAVITPFKDMHLSAISSILPNSWDIVAFLPPGMPMPSRKSNLTVLFLPVNTSFFRKTVISLLNVSVLRKDETDKTKKEIIQSCKEMIMKVNAVTEGEAHRLLQRISMKNAVSLEETALNIIEKKGDISNETKN